MLHSATIPRRSAVAALVCAAIVLAACRQEIAFTRVPFAGTGETDARSTETHVFADLPLDTAPLTAAVEAAAGDVLARSREYVDDIACDRRKGPWIECNGAILTSEITRTGPVGVSVVGGRLLFTMPLRYDIQARGHGWASYLTDRKSGTAVATLAVDVALGAGWRADPRLATEITWSVPPLSLLKGKIPLGRIADARLNVAMRAALEPLRAQLAPDRLRGLAERAWTTLHQPVALQTTPDIWLRALPDQIAAAGFAAADFAAPAAEARVAYRLALATRLAIHRGARPDVLFAKPLPPPTRIAMPANGDAAGPPRTRLLVPIDVGTGNLTAAVAAQFPRVDTLTTRPDSKSPSVVVRPLRAGVFVANDRLALELQLEIVEPQRLQGLSGKAYILGRPVFDAATGLLTLSDLGFPPAPKGAPRTPEGALRIGEEPFASRFAAAVRLDVGDALGALPARYTTLLNRPLGDDLALAARIDGVRVAHVGPGQAGFSLHVELTGTLALVPGGAGDASGRPTGSIERTSGKHAPTGGPARKTP